MRLSLTRCLSTGDWSLTSSRALTKPVREWTAASELGEAHPQRPPCFAAAAVNNPRTLTKPARGVGVGWAVPLLEPRDLQARFLSLWPLPLHLGPAFLPPTGGLTGTE